MKSALHLMIPLATLFLGLLGHAAALGRQVTDLAVPGEESKVFQVRVNGQAIRATAYKDVHYIHVAAPADAEIEVTARPAAQIHSFAIRPKHLGIKGTVTGNRLTFRAAGARQLLVNVDRFEKLFIFLEAPATALEQPGGKADKAAKVVNVADLGARGDGRTDITELVQRAIDQIPTGGTLYFPPGHYRTGTLTLHGEMTLHLAAGALLQATDDFRAIRPIPEMGDCIGYLVARDVSNLKITGLGTIDGNGYKVRRAHEAAAHKTKQSGRLLTAIRARNLVIDGVTLRDSYSWNTHVISSRDVVIRDVKILNDVRMGNGDGFDIDRCRDVLVEDCFVYAEDDALTPKARTSEDLENLTFRNCVVWSQNANGVRLGTESRCREMKNFTFENIAILRAKAMIRLDSMEGAAMEEMTFRDIWCEDFAMYANTAAASYPFNPTKPDETYLVAIKVYADHREASGEKPMGQVRNVLFERLHWDDERVGSKLRVADEASESRIREVEFRDCRLNGRLAVSAQALRLSTRGRCADVRVTAR